MTEVTPPLRRLTCFFKTENAAGDIVPDLSNNASDKVFVTQEQGKKSSFLLEPEESSVPFYTVEKPPNVLIEYENPHAAVPMDSAFFLGGFQMVSTAKTVEIYLTDMEGKEAYLTTSKGLSFNKEDKTAPWYKIICVVPGGPRPILKLRIKMLSLRPNDATTAKLQFMKLTARIADTPSPQPPVSSTENLSSPASGAFTPVSITTEGSSNSPTKSIKPKSVFFATPEPVKPEPRQAAMTASNGVTQSDLGAAMAGVSFMARSTEKGIEEALQEQTKRLEKSFGSCFMRMEQQLHFLQRHLIVQQQLIQENQEIVESQKSIIEEQNTQIRTLVNQQDDLKIRVQSLQADMSIIRYHRFETGGNLQGRKRDIVEETEDETKEQPPPPVMEIGTKVRDIDDAEDDGEDNDVISGIMDHSMEESRDVRDVHLENINLKNLILKTTREIEERPVTCGPSFPESSVACGMPSFVRKPIACVPDDQILFQGMMLTDEELRFQRMSQLRASKDAEDVFEEVPLQIEDGIPAEGVIGKTELEVEGAHDEAEEIPHIEPEEDAHVNIEVTLMEDGEEENEEEDEEDVCEQADAAYLEETEQRSLPSVEDLLAESVDDDEYQDFVLEGDATVAATNKRKDFNFQSMDEKKEMELVDTPDIAKLMMKAQQQEPQQEAQTFFNTRGFPCVSGSVGNDDA